jgi:imidazolonepropionase-like amidohydrolase
MLKFIALLTYQRGFPMTRYTKMLVAMTLVCSLAGCGGGSSSTTPENAAAVEANFFSGGTLIPGDGSPVIEDVTMLVENGKIKAIGKKGEVKPVQGAGRFDHTGQFIIPVLVNLHGHPGLNNGSSFGPDNFNKESFTNDLKRYLYYGVGAVLVAGTDKDDVSIQVRDEIRQGNLKAAAVYTAGRGLTAKGGWPSATLGPLVDQVATEANARGAVDEKAAKKVDFIKIWVDDNMGAVPKLKPEIYRAIIDQAHKKNLKVVAHVFYLADAKDLVKSGVDGIIHSIRDREVDDELVNDMKAKNVFYTPTLTAHEAKFTYAEDPKWLGEQSMREAYPATLSAYLGDSVFVGRMKRDPNLEKYREQFNIAKKNLKRLADGGVRIGMGTDSGTANTFPGYFEHRELQLMADAGMSPADIIKAATSVPAAIVGLTDGGSLAVGKKADFLVLTGNPLEKISNTKEIETMYLGGSSLERLPLIENIQTETHRFTQAERKQEAEAVADAARKAIDDKLPHYGKFPVGSSELVGGFAIPTPKYSQHAKKVGPPHVVTVTNIQGSAADVKGFYDAAMPKVGWTPAGGCFEKKNAVTNKTNAACVAASAGGAVITISEKK